MKPCFSESCGCGFRGEDYYARISDNRGREVDRMQTREVGMTYLTIELNACDTLKDLHRVLVEKMNSILAKDELFTKDDPRVSYVKELILK